MSQIQPEKNRWKKIYATVCRRMMLRLELLILCFLKFKELLNLFKDRQPSLFRPLEERISLLNATIKNYLG